MRLILKKPVVVYGCSGVGVGDRFEVDEKLGRDLIAEGLAEPAPVLTAPVIEQREPVIEHRDPKPKRGKKV